MRFKQIVETSAGATASGSIASVASPMGAVQTRSQKPPKAPKVVKGKKYANTLSEGAIKRIATDMEELSDVAFKNKYKKTKEEMRKSLKEEKIEEADLIVMPGMRRMKDTSFIPHKADRRDHEVEMARSDLFAAAKDAMRIFKLLKDRREEDGLMGWQQSYITLAADYLNSVADSIEYNAKVKGSLDEMTGGVLAGGMSNFEEGAPELLKKEMPLVRHAQELLAQNGVSKDDPDYQKHLAGTIKHLRKFGNIDRINKQDVEEAEKQGLWANIHAKRERIKKGSGERMRKPGSKGAPTAKAFKQSQKTSKKK